MDTSKTEMMYYIFTPTATVNKTDAEFETYFDALKPTCTPLSKPADCVAIAVPEFKDKTIKRKREIVNEVFRWKKQAEKKAIIITL
jgi:hypothetical protein